MGGVDDKVDGGVFGADVETDEPLSEKPERTQRGVARNPSDYIQTGAASVGIGFDGMPVVGGEKPAGPEKGLTDANLVCLGSEDGTRPECEHYTALLQPADGDAKGFGELRQIRRFCRFLATASELWEIDGNIYGCTSRSPQDLVSIKVVRDFERRQKEIARETAEKSGSLTF